MWRDFNIFNYSIYFLWCYNLPGLSIIYILYYCNTFYTRLTNISFIERLVYKDLQSADDGIHLIDTISVDSTKKTTSLDKR